MKLDESERKWITWMKVDQMDENIRGLNLIRHALPAQFQILNLQSFPHLS